MNLFTSFLLTLTLTGLLGCTTANTPAPTSNPETTTSIRVEPSAPPPESTVNDGSPDPSLNQTSFVRPESPCFSEPVLVVMPGVKQAGTAEIHIENRPENPGKVPPLFGDYVQIGRVPLRTNERLSFVFTFEAVMQDISSERTLAISPEKTYYVVVNTPDSSVISMGPHRIKTDCEPK